MWCLLQPSPFTQRPLTRGRRPRRPARSTPVVQPSIWDQVAHSATRWHTKRRQNKRQDHSWMWRTNSVTLYVHQSVFCLGWVREGGAGWVSLRTTTAGCVLVGTGSQSDAAATSDWLWGAQWFLMCKGLTDPSAWIKSRCPEPENRQQQK